MASAITIISTTLVFQIYLVHGLTVVGGNPGNLPHDGQRNHSLLQTYRALTPAASLRVDVRRGDGRRADFSYTMPKRVEDRAPAVRGGIFDSGDNMHSEVSKEVIGRAGHHHRATTHNVRNWIGMFCICFVVIAYILAYAVLIKWWYGRSEASSSSDSADEKSYRKQHATLAYAATVEEDDQGSAMESQRREGENNASPFQRQKKKKSFHVVETEKSVWAEEGFLQISVDDLIDQVGMSGMVIFPPGHVDGVAGEPSRRAVPVLFLQVSILQMAILVYMWVQLKPRPDGDSSLPGFLLFTSVYLHFLNCVQEVPYTVQIYCYFVDFHENLGDLLWMGFVLIADGFVIPVICFVLGALYLCTSTRVEELILNSVAVAFVREIDNWIIRFSEKTSFLGGKLESQKVTIPVDAKRMKAISLSVVHYPVIPACFSLACVWIGVSYLKL